MIKYTITSEPKEQFDHNGVSLGMSDKLAVFYSQEVGGKRYYRQSFSSPQKGLKLLAFKSIKKAEEVCNWINVFSGGTFKVETVEN
jgi:hypothetical protein